MRYRRIFLPGGTFFFTVVTYQRRPLFNSHTNIERLSRAIEKVRRSHPFTIIAQVILPDHLHTIWELPPDDVDYPTRWRLIKSGFSRQMDQVADPTIPLSRLRKKERTIWQRRYWEHTICDEDDLDNHIDYIHFNPVHHGLVKYPHEWSDSTFLKFVEDEYYPRDWSTSNIFKGIGGE
ncbi:MAG: transposase [Anaerolineaceae bacterium]|nr:transposase [Anaerolineaceae bacterium]